MLIRILYIQSIIPISILNMVPECVLKPYCLTTKQTPKLVLSSKRQNQFPSQTVEICGKPFLLQFQDQVNPEQVGISLHNKMFLYGMDDLPAQCKINPFDFKQEYLFKGIRIFLYYHSKMNQAKKEFSHLLLERRFRDLFNHQYFNSQQCVNFNMGKYVFDARIQTLQNQKTFGYIGEKTQLIFLPQHHQPFIIKNGESSDEQQAGLDIGKQKSSSAYSKYKNKIHQIKVGGLGEQLDLIARRIFASRSLGGALIEKIGLKHAKGILLYGPPGTGKTLLARQLSKVLDAQFKIINGPEIMDKFYGEGQKKLRQIFEPAIKQWKQKKYQSSLHVIIFDEIDSVTKKRGGSDSTLGDSLVNQLLTLIDGVDSPNNVLIIGMTNRKDLIDDALLRAGRLEVQIEIFLPNLKGREQIFDIHLKSYKKQGLVQEDVDTHQLAKIMKNYTGAQIELIVRAAWSIAAQENQQKGQDQSQIKMKNQHFLLARNDVTPQFGQDQKQIENLIPAKKINFSPFLDNVHNKILKFVKKCLNLKQGKLTLLIKGPPGSGKTTIAAECCKYIDVPFTKFSSVDKIYKLNQNHKAQHLTQLFEDSKKCDQSCIVLDDLLRLIQYVPLSSKYSNVLLQRIQHIIKSSPGKGKKQIIIATSDSLKVLDELGFSNIFRTSIDIGTLKRKQVKQILQIKSPNSQMLNQQDENDDDFTIKDVIQIIQQNSESPFSSN